MELGRRSLGGGELVRVAVMPWFGVVVGEDENWGRRGRGKQNRLNHSARQHSNSAEAGTLRWLWGIPLTCRGG